MYIAQATEKKSTKKEEEKDENETAFVLIKSEQLMPKART